MYMSHIYFLTNAGVKGSALKNKLFMMTGEDRFMMEGCAEALSKLLKKRPMRVKEISSTDFFEVKDVIKIVPAENTGDLDIHVKHPLILVGVNQEILEKVKLHGCAVNCKLIADYGKDIHNVISGLCRIYNVPMDEESKEVLIDRVGSSSFGLISGIRILEKIGRKITKQDVEEGLCFKRFDEVFELVTCVGFKWTVKALKVLHNIMQDESKSVLILDWLLNFYEKIWIVMLTPPEKRTEAYLSQILGVGSQWVRRYIKMQRLYTEQRARESYFIVLDAAVRLKHVKSPKSILSVLIYKLSLE